MPGFGSTDGGPTGTGDNLYGRANRKAYQDSRGVTNWYTDYGNQGGSENAVDSRGRANVDTRTSPGEKNAVLIDDVSYGGSRAAAAEERAEARKSEDYWASRKATPMDMSQANALRAQELGAREEQVRGQRATWDAARGYGPSAAMATNTAGVEEAVRMGAAGGGMSMYANAAGSRLGALGAGRAAETGAALDGHGSGAGAMRGGDVSMAGADTDQQRAMANDFYRQRGLNDGMELYYGKRGAMIDSSIRDAELKARATSRERDLQMWERQADFARKRAQEDAAVLSAAGTVASIASKSDGNMKYGITRMR
jgi:hypothetical protein